MSLDTTVQMYARSTGGPIDPIVSCNPGVLGPLPGVPYVPAAGIGVPRTCPMWATPSEPNWYLPQVQGVPDDPQPAGAQLDLTILFAITQSQLRGINTDALLGGLGLPPIPNGGALPGPIPYLQSYYFTNPARYHAQPAPGVVHTLLQGVFPSMLGLNADGLVYLDQKGTWNFGQPSVGSPATSKAVYIDFWQDPWNKDPVIALWNRLSQGLDVWAPLTVYVESLATQPGLPYPNTGCGQWYALQDRLYLQSGLPTNVRGVVHALTKTDCITTPALIGP